MRLEASKCGLALLTLQVLVGLCAAAGHYFQRIESSIGAGNFTYYKLNTKGNVRLMLVSTEGDADLYISSETLAPSYETYDSKSATCGYDIIDIDEYVLRPVGIAIYGHISYQMSKFNLDIIIFDDATFDMQESQTSDSSHLFPTLEIPPTPGEEESLFAKIFVYILKVLLDVLL